MIHIHLLSLWAILDKNLAVSMISLANMRSGEDFCSKMALLTYGSSREVTVLFLTILGNRSHRCAIIQ